MHVEACMEPPHLDALALLTVLQRALKCSVATRVLNARIAHEPFRHAVAYGPHCHGLRRVWVAEDGHQA